MMRKCTCANRLSPSLSCSIHKNSVDIDFFNLSELKIRFSEAYATLPECYKADSCLTFFIDINGNLCAEDDSGHEYMYASGTWVQGI